MEHGKWSLFTLNLKLTKTQKQFSFTLKNFLLSVLHLLNRLHHLIMFEYCYQVTLVYKSKMGFDFWLLISFSWWFIKQVWSLNLHTYEAPKAWVMLSIDGNRSACSEVHKFHHLEFCQDIIIEYTELRFKILCCLGQRSLWQNSTRIPHATCFQNKFEADSSAL